MLINDNELDTAAFWAELVVFCNQLKEETPGLRCNLRLRREFADVIFTSADGNRVSVRVVELPYEDSMTWQSMLMDGVKLIMPSTTRVS